MWLKIIIVILLLLAVASLLSGMIFLVKDKSQSTRLLTSLYTRVILCGLILILISFGIYTGELKPNAPWTKQVPSTASQ